MFNSFLMMFNKCLIVFNAFNGFIGLPRIKIIIILQGVQFNKCFMVFKWLVKSVLNGVYGFKVVF